MLDQLSVLISKLYGIYLFYNIRLEIKSCRISYRKLMVEYDRT